MIAACRTGAIAAAAVGRAVDELDGDSARHHPVDRRLDHKVLRAVPSSPSFGWTL